jgi:DNA-binding beta-propeller fold protein YncE
LAAQTGNYITEYDSDFTGYTQYSLEERAPVDESSLDPHDMILSPSGDKLVITCQKSNEVRVFDLLQKKVVKVILTPLYPQEIVYSEKFNTYYVSCMGDGSKANSGAVIAIDGSSYSTTSLKVGAQPHGIAIDAGKNLVYVLSRNISGSGPLPHHTSLCAGRNGFVNFIDQRTFTLTDQRYELSVDPYFIFARP